MIDGQRTFIGQCSPVHDSKRVASQTPVLGDGQRVVTMQVQRLPFRNRQVIWERQIAKNTQKILITVVIGQNALIAYDVFELYPVAIGGYRVPRPQLAAGDDEALDVDGFATGFEIAAVDDEVDVSADAGTGLTMNLHDSGIEDDRGRGFAVGRAKDGVAPFAINQQIIVV